MTMTAQEPVLGSLVNSPVGDAQDAELSVRHLKGGQFTLIVLHNCYTLFVCFLQLIMSL